ncbi:MAG: class I mannose-6-phosphate isomerase [Trueperaceae bacterium]|nr:class I mannose-6-phosphate isomerase [Trueperaceae bacterium]
MPEPNPSEPTARAGSFPPLPRVAPPDPGRYRLVPTHPLPNGQIGLGFDALAERLAETLAGGGRVWLDGYVGVAWGPLCEGLREALARRGVQAAWVDVRTAMRDEDAIDALLAPYLGNEPVFGHRYPGGLRDLFDDGRLAALRERVRGENGPVVAFGPGAALLGEDGRGAGDGNGVGGAPAAPALLAYVDVPKNEIQYRARAGAIPNLGKAEPEDAKAMYKRFYFVDWVVANRHKQALLPRADLWIDGQRADDPACVAGAALREGLASLTARPFRARPWFEPGAWGGQWLKRRIPELPGDVPNYAWSFELIAPENGLVFAAGGRLLEVSFDTLMAQEHARVLGPKGARFGASFPIRFDFLDTVEGGNLSLQCHPTRDTIQEAFGEPVMTQDESYYMLHVEPGSEVFLGLQQGADLAAFRAELERSAREGTEVEVRRYVQAHPAARHELFLIPAGTVHCSGAGNVVLEISSTPYIFTFKMYDWLRRDLDGRPRPLNVARAFHDLDPTRRGEAVDQELIARPRVLREDGPDRVVQLPTHPAHDYDVCRLEFTGAVEMPTEGSCHVLSLVEGDAMRIETEGEAYRHYFAETVVVPASVGRYRVCSEDGRPCKVVVAYLK